LLAYASLMLGDYLRAAVYAEHLARSAPQSNRASLAALHALEAYSRLLADEEARLAGLPDDAADGAARASLLGQLATDRKRLQQLARFIEETWPDEAVADAARHQTALLLLRDKKYVE